MKRFQIHKEIIMFYQDQKKPGDRKIDDKQQDDENENDLDPILEDEEEAPSVEIDTIVNLTP